MSSIAARTETAEQRSAIYAALLRRNRMVGALRIGIPALGAVLVLVLVLQFWIASLVPDFGFANVTIDRDNLVVEAPAYEGTGADGSRYSMSAESARAAIGNPDLINLTGAGFTLNQPDGNVFSARSARANLRVSNQLVIAEGPTSVRGSSGVSGTVEDATIDVLGERLVAGRADLAFEGGTSLTADTMSYDGKAKVWIFSRATLMFNTTPGEAGYLERQNAGAPAGAKP